MAVITHRRLNRRRSADDGAVMAEYGLLVMLVAIVVAAVLPTFGIAVRDLYTFPIPL